MSSKEDSPFERKAEDLISCSSLGSLEVYKPAREWLVWHVALDICQASTSFWESVLHASELAAGRTTSGAFFFLSCLSALAESPWNQNFAREWIACFISVALCCCWDIRVVHETSWQKQPQWGEQHRCISDTVEPSPEVVLAAPFVGTTDLTCVWRIDGTILIDTRDFCSIF